MRIHFIEKLYSFYYQLPNWHQIGLLGKAIDKALARLLKPLLDRFLPDHYLKSIEASTLSNNLVNKPQIICSLTTFPGRINQVWIAIESLFRQSIKPDRIILWLSEEQFKEKMLPDSIEKLKVKGLEVMFRKDDLKAHKKYLYAIQEFPHDWIITFDDDLYHDYRSIENILKLKQKFPDFIVTNRAHRLRFNKKTTLLPYRRWKHNTTYSGPAYSLMATGGCGTLYEAKLIHSDFCNTDHIKKMSFHADDIWLKVMATLQGTQVVTNKRYGKDPIVIGKTQNEKLVTTNVLSGGNDKQLAALMEYYSLSVKDFQD